MTGLKAKVILLSADTYRITDQQTGEINSGMNFWYIMAENLDNKDREARGDNVSKGILPTQGSLPVEKVLKLKSVPGIYEFTLEMKTVKQTAHGQSKMNAQIAPVDLDFVGDIKLTVDKPKP